MHRFILGVMSAMSVIAFGAVPASAQGNVDPAEMMERADVNGDGNISWAEMTQSREKAFTKLDRNRDGSADKKDRPTFGGARFDEAMRTFAPADANRDGRISRSEFMNAPSPAFEAADTNNDRVVTAAEAKVLKTARGK
jgi:hypothetical protein